MQVPDTTVRYFPWFIVVIPYLVYDLGQHFLICKMPCAMYIHMQLGISLHSIAMQISLSVLSAYRILT